MWMTGQPIEIMAAHGNNESGLRHFSSLEKRENIVKTYLSWPSRLVLRGFQKAKTRTRARVRSRKDEVLLCKAWKQPQRSRESGMQSVIGGVANVNRAAESAHSGSLVACSWNSLVSPRLSVDVGAMETRSTTGSSA